MNGAPTRRTRRTGMPGAAQRRRKRMQRLAVTITLGVVLLALLVAGGFFGVRALARGGFAFGPASVRVTATPADARVSFASATGTGTVSASDLDPGVYKLKVSRRGFKTVTQSVTLKRGQRENLTIALKPAPTKLTLDVRPETARYTITCSDGATKSGTGSFSGKIPAGDTTVKIEAKGCEPVDRTLFLDAPTKITEWLDPSGQIVHKLAVFKSVPAPKGVAITPDNKELWVTALVTQPSIEIYDPKTGKKIDGVNMGSSGAVEVLFNKDGTRAYASQMQSASVYEIDTKARKVLRRFKTGSSWTKIVTFSADGKHLYAANWTGDDISEIDIKTGKLIRKMPTVDTPRGMWPTADGKRLFVAGFGESSGVGRLGVIDLKTGKTKVFYEKKGAAMRHMIADEKRGVVFTSDLGQDLIWETDMKTLKTTKFVETDRKPNTIDLSPDGKVLFVSCRGENNPKSYYLAGPEWGTVLLFDSHTAKPLDAIIGGNQCTALDLSDDGTLLAFSDFIDGKMHTYEIPPFETLAKGNGGRYLAHYKEIVRPGWSDWQGPQPPSN